jgi:transposase
VEGVRHEPQIAAWMNDTGSALDVSTLDRQILQQWSRSRILAARVVLRSQIVLRLADGESVRAVGRGLRVAPATVRLWRRRFLELGPPGLLRDAPGRGRKPALDAAVRQTLRAAGNGFEPLAARTLARILGVSASTVSRWRRQRDGLEGG